MTDKDQKFLMVYITVGQIDEARHLAKLLVEKGLAACCNIIPQMESVYRWQDKVTSSKELIVIAKTTDKNWADLEQAVKDHHSYDCPCIVAYPLTRGHEPFMDWIAAECAR